MKITNAFYKLTGFALFDWRRNRLNKSAFKWYYHIIAMVLWLVILPFLVLQFLGLFRFFDKLRLTSRYRFLSQHEIVELQLVYQNSVNYDLIRVVEWCRWAKFGSRFVANDHLGFVFLNTIHFSRKINTEKSLNDMAWLVHEVTHVSQYQKYGVVYIVKALRAQRNGGYGYQPEWLCRSIKDFNFEQQAEVAKAYYLDIKSGKGKKLLTSLVLQIRHQQFL